MVRSQLEYAASVWSPWTLKEIEAVEKVQKRATKMIEEYQHLKYEDRLKCLKLPTLRYRRIRGDLLILFKIMTADDRRCFPQVKLHEDNPTRGHHLKLDKQPFKTNLRKNYFTCRITKLWNSLNVDVVSAENVLMLEKLLNS